MHRTGTGVARAKAPPSPSCANLPRVSRYTELEIALISPRYTNANFDDIQRRIIKGDHIGEFEELVLLAVSALDDGAYGVAIKELLDRETRRDVSIGAVYAALDRLEAKTLIVSHRAVGPAERGGRMRRGFDMTADGRRTLRAMRAVRERLWRASPARGR